MDNSPSVFGSIRFNEIEKGEILKLSALNYTPSEIALYLGMDAKKFCKEAETFGTEINLLLGRGKFVNKVGPELQLQTLAEEGNITAIQELRKLTEQRTFDSLIQQIDSYEL